MTRRKKIGGLEIGPSGSTAVQRITDARDAVEAITDEVQVDRAGAVIVDLPEIADFLNRGVLIQDRSGAAATNNITINCAAASADTFPGGGTSITINVDSGLAILTPDRTDGVWHPFYGQSTSPAVPPAHASTHARAGTDVIDGDVLDIDFTPTYYAPSVTPGEVTHVDELTAHLAGVDDYLGTTITAAAVITNKHHLVGTGGGRATATSIIQETGTQASINGPSSVDKEWVIRQIADTSANGGRVIGAGGGFYSYYIDAGGNANMRATGAMGITADVGNVSFYASDGNILFFPSKNVIFQSTGAGRDFLFRDTAGNIIVGIDNRTPDNALLMTSTEITWNQDGADLDHRWESDTRTHALFLRGSDGYFGINQSAPLQDLDVGGNIRQTMHTDNVSNPPTDAELDAIFGTPAANGAGATFWLDDAGGEANTYLIVSTGTKWQHTLMTTAV